MKLIIISSPSGGGKTSVCKKLIESPSSPVFGKAEFSVSATTRAPRGGEVNGKEYFFISKEKFNEMIEKGEFLEHAEVFGNLYGTPINKISNNLYTVFDIDYQGAIQIKKKMPAVSIFLLPPSLKALEDRIKSRGDITPEQMQIRISKAAFEIEQAKLYDYIVLNDDLEIAFQKVSNIITSEIIKDQTFLIKNMKTCKEILDLINSKF
jgi:guanylate kinase